MAPGHSGSLPCDLAEGPCAEDSTKLADFDINKLPQVIKIAFEAFSDSSPEKIHDVAVLHEVRVNSENKKSAGILPLPSYAFEIACFGKS